MGRPRSTATPRASRRRDDRWFGWSDDPRNVAPAGLHGLELMRWMFPGLPPERLEVVAREWAGRPFEFSADFAAATKALGELRRTQKTLDHGGPSARPAEPATSLIAWVVARQAVVVGLLCLEHIVASSGAAFPRMTKSETANNVRYAFLISRLRAQGFSDNELAEVVFACSGGYVLHGPRRELARKSARQRVKKHRTRSAREPSPVDEKSEIDFLERLATATEALTPELPAQGAALGTFGPGARAPGAEPTAEEVREWVAACSTLDALERLAENLPVLVPRTRKLQQLAKRLVDTRRRELTR